MSNSSATADAISRCLFIAKAQVHVRFLVHKLALEEFIHKTLVHISHTPFTDLFLKSV
jgi:hypothetical protein